MILVLLWEGSNLLPLSFYHFIISLCFAICKMRIRNVFAYVKKWYWFSIALPALTHIKIRHGCNFARGIKFCWKGSKGWAADFFSKKHMSATRKWCDLHKLYHHTKPVYSLHIFLKWSLVTDQVKRYPPLENSLDRKRTKGNSYHWGWLAYLTSQSQPNVIRLNLGNWIPLVCVSFSKFYIWFSHPQGFCDTRSMVSGAKLQSGPHHYSAIRGHTCDSQQRKGQRAEVKDEAQWLFCSLSVISHWMGWLNFYLLIPYKIS